MQRTLFVTDKMDKGKIKCFYCSKMGHKGIECHKKKKKAEEKEKKEKEKGGRQKSVNAHISLGRIKDK